MPVSSTLHRLARLSVPILTLTVLFPSLWAQQPSRVELGRPPEARRLEGLDTQVVVVPRAPWGISSWLDTSNRAAIVSAYKNTFVPTVGTPVNWTGSVDANNPGTTSATYKDAVGTRINWFRAMAGIPANITLDATYSAKDQKAALMFSANNQLSHTPPTSWKDYSADGAEAAGKSNICWMQGTPLSNDPGCIQGYIFDDGSSNYYVGHRRWLLFPQTQVMGTGDVTESGPYGSGNAVWVQDGHSSDPRPTTRDGFVAWPPPGYVPYQVIPSRWSISYPNADFRNAVVSVKRGSTTIPVTLETVYPTPGSGSYVGENTLVFAPSSPFTSPPSSDTAITVSITNVSGAGPFNYTVTVINPDSGGSLTAPTLLSPANGATGQATSNLSLDWTPSSGATSYDVYLSTSNPPAYSGNVTSDSATVSNLSAGTTYYWYIVAKNSSSTGTSSVWSFTTAGSGPSAPTLSSPSNGATGVSTSASISWYTSSGATSYDVYFGTSSSPSYVANTTGTSYVPSMSPGTTYYWKIVAKNSSGSGTSSTWSFTTASTGPSAPTLSSPSNGATGVSTSASLSWYSASGATSYDVYFGTSSSPSYITNTTSTSYSLSMSAGTTYYWKIVARNSSGTATSATWSFTTAASGPGSPSLASPSNGATGVSTGASLYWSSASGATSYDVYFGTSSSPSYVTNTTSLTYSPTLAAGTTYYWKIVARNSAGSAASSTWWFTTASAGPATPTLISPSSGATNIPRTGLTLRWNAASGATSYDVYISSYNPPSFAGTVSGAAADITSTLSASTTYYWYVVARNAAGTSPSSTWSFTTQGASGPAAPTLLAPANGAAGMPTDGVSLSWNAVSGATSYDVYISRSNPPAYAGTVTGNAADIVSTLLTSTTYYWYVVANNSQGSASSQTWSFTTTSGGSLSSPSLSSPSNGATGVSTGSTLSWGTASGATSYDVYFGTYNPPPYVTNTTSTSYTPSSLTGGSTYYWYVLAKNSYGTAQSSTWSFTTQSAGSSTNGLLFVPVTPCRVIDTRSGQGTSGSFGPPTLSAGAVRSFPIPQGRCSIPSTAQAYSVNVTVVPGGNLGYLSLWPQGQSQPTVSTLNAPQGGIVANAAIVPAGSSGGISAFVTDNTEFIVDINGYFDSTTSSSAYALYPVTPCRIADTRNATGVFGGPTLSAGQSRDFPIPSSSCGIPSSAQAYSTNVTVVPSGFLGYLTLWPTGSSQPFVSTLNSPSGKIVANAALVPSGSGGGVSAFVTDRSDVILDINGYFASPYSSGALRFYPVTPCRVIDTRNANGSFGGPIMSAGSTRSVPVASSGCSIPSNAQAYSMNVTVVPSEPLGYLSIWPTGQSQPWVSTLNSDGRIVANAAIVPAGTGGAISVYVTNQTHVIMDINGYFAP